MIADKRIDRIVLIAVAAAMLFCIGAILLAPRLLENADVGVTMGYEEMIFDTSAPVVVDIQMDADEWQTMLDTATQEIYHQCDVVINGTKFLDVGIRPKGNTSLSSIAMDPNNDRYSFKLEFDQFIDGQTAWGLDKLCLNNNYADATNMKEALVYDMYKFLGADASLYNYAEIYVNGEYWGVYLALEAVEESFLLRNYGAAQGALYKPDSIGKSPDRDEERDAPDFGASREASAEPEPTPVPTAEPDPMPPQGELSDAMKELVAPVEERESASGEASGSGEASVGFAPPGGGPGGGPFSGSGQNLNYTGDDPDSYSTIWDCEITKTTKADHLRVIEALKHNSEGTEIEEYMDVDNLLRYMAVHNFSVNSDSLSGGMAHNYYLYESGGRLNILPWDYNLAFGGMNGGSEAAEVVNDPIDDSWESTDFFDCLLENEECLARYHALYRELIEDYVFGGGLDEFYTRTRKQIDGLVASDPNALYDFDEYDAAAQTLYYLSLRRGESILGQIDGTIPSTSRGQRSDSSALIDASDIDISVMGTMFGGGGFGGGGGFPGGFNPFSGEPSGEASRAPNEAAGPDASEERGSQPTNEPSTVSESEEESSGEAQPSEEESARPEHGPSGEPPAASGEMSEQPSKNTVWLLALCAGVLIAGLVFAASFRKKG